MYKYVYVFVSAVSNSKLGKMIPAALAWLATLRFGVLNSFLEISICVQSTDIVLGTNCYPLFVFEDKAGFEARSPDILIFRYSENDQQKPSINSTV